MKKLSLTPNAFNKGEVLTRAQLKKIKGGNGSGGPCIELSNVCSPIFEDVCCQYPGMSVSCKGASGTSPGMCNT